MPSAGSTATNPTASLIPQRPTIPRASIVACWMSDSAPVVMVAEGDLLRHAAAHGHLDLPAQVGLGVVEHVGVRRGQGHAEGLPAGSNIDTFRDGSAPA